MPVFGSMLYKLDRRPYINDKCLLNAINGRWLVMSGKQKILIVDDDPTILKFLTEVLSKDYHLTAFSTGEQALESIVDIGPDIVLLDIMLTGINGYEICARIRENPQIPDIKIIFLSAKVDLNEKLKGYKVGGDDYITKPFEVDELLAKLKVFSRLQYQDERKRPLNDIFDEKQLEIFYKIQRQIADVVYIKSDSPYCHVICVGQYQKTDRLRIAIQALEAYFSGKKLVRVHRSYLVNPRKILSINRQKNNELKLIMVGADDERISIPVGRSYQQRLKAAIPSLFPG